MTEFSRAEPLIWRKWVNISSRAVDVELKEGEEPADAIFKALKPLCVTFLDWRKVTDAAKSDGVTHTRKYGLAFSRTMRTEDSLLQSNMRIYDNMKEPVDMIYQFALMNSDMEHFNLMIILALLHICEVLPSHRLVPLVFTKVLSNKDGTSLGRLYIIYYKEPIDIIDSFIQAY